MKLNRVSLNVVGLNRIGLNRIGSPSRRGSSGSDRPYIDPEVLASLKAVCICYGKSNDDPDRAVVKNLVDPDNPFVISNAAFKLNSGFGEYSADFESFDWAVNISQKQHNKATISLNGRLCNHTAIEVDEMKVNIIGNVTELIYWYIANPDDTTRSEIRLTSGINTLPKSYAKDDGQTYNIGFAYISGDSEITIEQIPSFKGAFVTDGINDLITSTKTVQEMLGGSNELTIVSMIHQIKESIYNDRAYTNYINGTSGHIRNQVANTKTGIYGYTVTDLNSTSIKGSVINDILGDKNDYQYDANTNVELDNAKYSVQNYIKSDGTVSNIGSQLAWYWTIIANKVLTTDQINQVIAYFNLDRTLKPDILCDVIKQGITNENHAEFGDKLIDFSGNGRDIQLNNIAWKGDSGIGKYEVDFSTWSGAGIVIGNGVGFKIERETTSWWGMSAYGDTSGLGSFTIKVTNCHDPFVYRYKDEDGNWKDYPIESDGIYTLPASGAKDDKDNYRFFNSNPNATYNGLTVEQIPSHAGALCFDGVDDFGINKDVPTFIDFTVIAKRTWLEENTSDKPFIIKGDSLYPDGNQNAFLFEYGKLSTYSFGQNNKYDESVVPSLISYATTYSYNGVVPLVRGSATDTIGIDVAHSTKIALYFLMLFPYSMSEFLIERQLKKHKLGTLYPDMVEFRPIVKSNLPYSSISYSVNPGEYISVDSMVTITVTLPNISDKLMEVSCNAISDISISGDNGVYEITGKIVKSPQKINMIISSYLTMLSNSTLISNETLIKNE